MDVAAGELGSVIGHAAAKREFLAAAESGKVIMAGCCAVRAASARRGWRCSSRRTCWAAAMVRLDERRVACRPADSGRQPSGHARDPPPG